MTEPGLTVLECFERIAVRLTKVNDERVRRFGRALPLESPDLIADFLLAHAESLLVGRVYTGTIPPFEDAELSAAYALALMMSCSAAEQLDVAAGDETS
jgi:hypothetical protein